MRIVVRAFKRSDVPDERISPCGYAEGNFLSYSESDIKKLKKQARENLKEKVKLKKGQRVKYKVQII